MVNNLPFIILILLFVFLLGIIITYLYNRVVSVSKNDYQKLKDDFKILESNLEIKKVLESELRESLNKMTNEFNKIKDINSDMEYQITRLEVEMDSLNQRYNEKEKIITEQNKEIQIKTQENLHLKEQLVVFKANNENLMDRIEQKNREYEEARSKSLVEFENIANKLFEEKTSKFSKESKENLDQILQPLRENISEFKKKVEEVYDKESKERFSLENKIKELVELNQQISKEANNLTNALKGSTKAQGEWGEMILENILEHSGLVKNREYFVQSTFVDEKGGLKRPDIIIKYPDDRYIIVDSKVSLTAYERYINTDIADEQKMYLNQHVKSLKNHIDNLSSKEYEKFDKTLDFVMLFVPIEPAYMTVLQKDPEIWNYAYKKRILLISPTNLIAALKLVSDIWKRDYQNKNAIAIARRGEKLYEKFVGFVSDMEELGRFIDKTSGRYSDAMKKLSEGRGNLIGQADKLRKLGVSSRKRLPDKYFEEE